MEERDLLNDNEMLQIQTGDVDLDDDQSNKEEESVDTLEWV